MEKIETLTSGGGVYLAPESTVQLHLQLNWMMNSNSNLNLSSAQILNFFRRSDYERTIAIYDDIHACM